MRLFACCGQAFNVAIVGYILMDVLIGIFHYNNVLVIVQFCLTHAVMTMKGKGHLLYVGYSVQ